MSREEVGTTLWLSTLTSTTTLTLDFQGQILKKKTISGIWGSIDMEWKGCESKACWTLSYDLDLGLSRSNFRRLYPRNGMVDWHGKKMKSTASRTHFLTLNWRVDWHGMIGMWVDRMLDPLSDIELWTWPWIFMVKFWNSCIIMYHRNGMANWTLTYDLTHDLQLGFQRQIFK